MHSFKQRIKQNKSPIKKNINKLKVNQKLNNLNKKHIKKINHQNY